MRGTGFALVVCVLGCVTAPPDLEQEGRLDSGEAPVASPLPLPDDSAQYAVKQCLDAHAEELGPYQPLTDEYRVYLSALGGPVALGDADLKALGARVGQSKAKSHWVFVAGLLEMWIYMRGEGAQAPREVREAQFLTRAKTLGFLGRTLARETGRDQYVTLIRSAYVEINRLYFYRRLSEKPGSIPSSH